MRKFAFVILDNKDSEQDRYNLDHVDGLSGLGFDLKLSKIETDVEDYITSIVQKKQTLGLTVHHLKGYQQGDALKLWLSRHINDCLCVEYTTSQRVSYIEGKVTTIGETELTEYGDLEQKVTFQPTTPFFAKINNDVTIQLSDKGKSYPYMYPYHYGRNVMLNNEITNTYIKDTPLIVTIYGTMVNPIITLEDENGEIYNEVRFTDVEIGEGQCLIINSAQRKILFDDGNGNLIDYYYKLSGGYDSYLRAKALSTSKININLTALNTGRLIGSRRQYRL